VNRFWQQFFGTGIVKTSGDFGAQGEWPSHPELLDWLATEFMGSGWDVKHMLRLMVTSATYRQSSVGDSGPRPKGSAKSTARSRSRGFVLMPKKSAITRFTSAVAGGKNGWA
jgi:hypothetical protein